MEPTIYLFFKGNCLEAMTHYAEILGGEIKDVFRNADVPDPQYRIPGSDDMVMNMAMSLGDTLVLASDNTDDMYQKPRGFYVSIAPTSREEFDRLHTALAREAESIEMPPEETFWAERFAMFTDKYGTPWMLNYEGGKAQGGSPA
ncbi:VOC family protein [Microbulbifer sp. TYP-18]|uniref:VOC family protein n=1 Tax=Microbulbifer sp. TYP-18 TaxID=3230024 RepID=UPI0034C5DCB3